MATDIPRNAPVQVPPNAPVDAPTVPPVEVPPNAPPDAEIPEPVQVPPNAPPDAPKPAPSLPPADFSDIDKEPTFEEQVLARLNAIEDYLYILHLGIRQINSKK